MVESVRDSDETVDAETVQAAVEAPGFSSAMALWGKPFDERLSWEQFFDPDLLQTWAAEVIRSLAARDRHDWLLTGTAIVLQYEDGDEAALLLQMAAQSAGLDFARVPADEVANLLGNPREAFAAHAPALVMLDYGDWAIGSAAPFDPSGTAFAVRLRAGLADFDPERPVILAVCCADPDSLSREFREAGGFDRCFIIQPPDAAFSGQRFLGDLGEGLADAELVASPTKLGRVIVNCFPARQDQRLAALYLQRLSRREGRRVDFNDLAHLAIRGSRESSAKGLRVLRDTTRRKTAHHEAGHACIAVIESGGENVPDYASIVPARDFEGIVMESLAYRDRQDEFTFQALQMRTRWVLAGRAAEELFFGPLQVSSGAESDLEMATRMCLHSFGRSGFHPDMGRGEGSSENLAVVVGDLSALENERVSAEVRRFMAEQYQETIRVLQAHRPFVEAVAERLLWDPVIDQHEMAQLAEQHGISVLRYEG